MRAGGYGLRRRRREDSRAGWLVMMGLVLILAGFALRNYAIVVFPFVLYPYERMGNLLMIVGSVLFFMGMAEYIYRAYKKRSERVRYLLP